MKGERERERRENNPFGDEPNCGTLWVYMEKSQGNPLHNYYILIKMFKIFLKDAQVLTAYEQQIWA
jgi:hypothetical protein